MDDDSASPASQGPPPPDLPQPSLPPPSLPPVPEPAPPPVPTSSAPAVQMNLRKDSDDEPDEALAPFNTRMIAAIIDVLISAGIQIAAAMILPGFLGRTAWLIGAAYLVTRDSLPFLGGQSIGKKAMHLRAVTLDGKPLTGNWEPGLIRNAVLMIPFFALVEIFILLSREGKPDHGRRLGDEWAKTKVIVVPVGEKSV